MAARSICVLGGSGFVGTHLCSALARDGWRITVPTRDPARATPPWTDCPRSRWSRRTSTIPVQLAALCAGQQAVVNLVGILNESGRGGSGFRARTSSSCGSSSRPAGAQRVDRLLHMSALNADADSGPSHYLKSKGRGERIVREECGPDLAWTIFQPSVIFGPHDDFVNRFARLLRVIPLGLPLARPGARFAPVWIGDVVASMQRALADDGTAGEIYELCGPERMTLREIVTPSSRSPRPRPRRDRDSGRRGAPAGCDLRLRSRQAVLDRQLQVAAGRQRLQD